MARSLCLVALLAVAANAGPIAQVRRPMNDLRYAPLTARQEAAPAPTPTDAPPLPTACSIEVAEDSTLTRTVQYEAPAEGTLTSRPEIVEVYTISGGPLCRCGGTPGTVMAIITSVGKDGQNSYYCDAAATATNDVLSVEPSATGTPGDPNNEAWAQVNCDGVFGSIYNNPWEQWNGSGAAAAFADAKRAWDGKTIEEISYPNFLGNFFSLRPDMKCDEMENANCEVTMNCGQGINVPNGVTSSPAGYVIGNSMVWLHLTFENVWNGISSAFTAVDAELGMFVTTFSPIVKDIADQQKAKLIMDGIQMALFIVLAPTFHGLFAPKRSDFVSGNPNFVDGATDVIYGGIGTGMAFAKDAMASLSTLPIQNQYSSYISETVTAWRKGLETGVANLFNSPDALFGMIDHGMLFGNTPAKKPTDMINIMKKTLFASIIAGVWTSGTEADYPVIIRDEGVKQTGTGCEGLDASQYTTMVNAPGTIRTVFHWDNDVAKTARICDGDHAFWMMTTKTGKKTTNWNGGPGPANNVEMVHMYFNTPRGLETLNGTGWGGLRKEEVAFNAINSWRVNGEKNGWASLNANLDDAATIESLTSGDLGKSYGVVKIPVCTLEEMGATVYADPDGTNKDNKNFPCPPTA